MSARAAALSRGAGIAALRRAVSKVAVGYAFVVPALALYVFFVIYPFISSIYYSLTSWDGAQPVKVFVGLANYRRLLSDPLVGQSLLHNLIWVIMGTISPIVIGLLLGVLLWTGARGMVAFRTIYFLPTVTSLVAVSLVWGVIYNPTFGLLNLVLRSLGLKGMAWLSDAQTKVLGVPLPMICLVVTYVWQDMGYNLVIFIAGLQSIPEVFKEAALVDGATSWQRFRYVTLPLLRSTLTFVIVMTMLSSWQVFVIFYVMTRGGPGNATRTLVLHIYETAFRHQEMGLAATMAMALFLIILVTTLIQLRLLRKEWEY